MAETTFALVPRATDSLPAAPSWARRALSPRKNFARWARRPSLIPADVGARPNHLDVTDT